MQGMTCSRAVRQSLVFWRRALAQRSWMHGLHCLLQADWLVRFSFGRGQCAILMGEAPSEARQRQFIEIVSAVAGVRRAPALRAHYVGTEMHVHIEIQVDAWLTVGQAHDIGEAVRTRLEAEPDVSRCSVHIDPTST